MERGAPGSTAASVCRGRESMAHVASGTAGSGGAAPLLSNQGLQVPSLTTRATSREVSEIHFSSFLFPRRDGSSSDLSHVSECLIIK